MLRFLGTFRGGALTDDQKEALFQELIDDKLGQYANKLGEYVVFVAIRDGKLCRFTADAGSSINGARNDEEVDIAVASLYEGIDGDGDNDDDDEDVWDEATSVPVGISSKVAFANLFAYAEEQAKVSSDKKADFFALDISEGKKKAFAFCAKRKPGKTKKA
ncbi:MAG: hypothetical protein LBM12_02165 [Candidatus Nomurabacteria bacterium]|nr:hypothetical protein [Candidatus Nomurabacteria bacterium]